MKRIVFVIFVLVLLMLACQKPYSSAPAVEPDIQVLNPIWLLDPEKNMIYDLAQPILGSGWGDGNGHEYYILTPALVVYDANANEVMWYYTMENTEAKIGNDGYGNKRWSFRMDNEQLVLTEYESKGISATLYAPDSAVRAVTLTKLNYTALPTAISDLLTALYNGQ